MIPRTDQPPTPEQVADLEAWAEASDFAGLRSDPALTGAAASAAGRALVEAAGVDVGALERSLAEPGAT